MKTEGFSVSQICGKLCQSYSAREKSCLMHKVTKANLKVWSQRHLKWWNIPKKSVQSNRIASIRGFTIRGKVNLHSFTVSNKTWWTLTRDFVPALTNMPVSRYLWRKWRNCLSALAVLNLSLLLHHPLSEDKLLRQKRNGLQANTCFTSVVWTYCPVGEQADKLTVT